MSYKLEIKNGEVINETGTFFRAGPFSITQDQNCVTVSFKRNKKMHVIYELTENDTALFELEHPDYSPECEGSEINTILKTKAGNSVVNALIQLKICKDKKLIEFFKQNPQSFVIEQDNFDILA